MTTKRSFLGSIIHIVECADITLAVTILGLSMVSWGLIGMVVHPDDLNRFAQDFMFKNPLLWGLNSIGVGIAMLWLAVHKFPHTASLLVGTYGCVIYTWIAMSRPVSSITSGVTLNFVVILMSVLLIHRSGRGNEPCC